MYSNHGTLGLSEANNSPKNVANSEDTYDSPEPRFTWISKKTISLPKSLRHALRTPIGRLICDRAQLKRMQKTLAAKYVDRGERCLLICVGDVVTMTIKKWGILCDFYIIDGMSQRKALNNKKSVEYIKKSCHIAPNEAGTLSYDAVKVLYSMIIMGPDKAMKKGIFIRGEEDLMTLPAIIFAPLGSVILYGQRNRGMIAVPVTEEKKTQTERLLHAFLT